MIKVLTKFEKELHKIENLNVFGWKLVKFGYVRSNHKITMNIAIHVQIEMFISMVKFKWSFFFGLWNFDQICFAWWNSNEIRFASWNSNEICFVRWNLNEIG